MSESKNKIGIWGTIGKLGTKFLAALPKLLKFVKLIKFGLLALTFASYAYLFTWKFALLIMIAVGWHEAGHVHAMKRVGIATRGFFYLPFFGGVALASSKPKTYRDWSFVAMMGPIFGFGLAIATYVSYLITGLPMLAAATSWMAMINLLNLIPLTPFDGGHVLKAISFSVSKTKGLIAVGAISVIAIIVLAKLHIMLFVFFGILGLFSTIGEYWQYKRGNRKVAEAMDGVHENWLGHEYAMPEGYLAECEQTYRNIYGVENHPTSMTRKEIAITTLAYLASVFALVMLMMVTARIPGADIASNFMADK